MRHSIHRLGKWLPKSHGHSQARKWAQVVWPRAPALIFFTACEGDTPGEQCLTDTGCSWTRNQSYPTFCSWNSPAWLSHIWARGLGFFLLTSPRLHLEATNSRWLAEREGNSQWGKSWENPAADLPSVCGWAHGGTGDRGRESQNSPHLA